MNYQHVLAHIKADNENSCSASAAVAGDAISAHFYVSLGHEVICLYSVVGITGRTMWIINLFIFEWGDEIKVSLFGIDITSVIHDHALSFHGNKTYLPR
jgi:hypothetical protein